MFFFVVVVVVVVFFCGGGLSFPLCFQINNECTEKSNYEITNQPKLPSRNLQAQS